MLYVNLRSIHPYKLTLDTIAIPRRQRIIPKWMIRPFARIVLLGNKGRTDECS